MKTCLIDQYNVNDVNYLSMIKIIEFYDILETQKKLKEHDYDIKYPIHDS